jgi:hydroxymethylpyrimidine pyrophosphatase-like HAD family hydrolase
MSDPTPLVPFEHLRGPARARVLAPIRVVATDVDGTLTRGRALDPAVVRVLGALAANGIEIVPVSGRPAGEVLGLCRYLCGVERAIAENGLLEVIPDQPPRWLGNPTDREQLPPTGRFLDAERGAGLRLAPDHPFRLGDVAYERDGRGLEELLRLRDAAAERGVSMIWSSVHIHLTPEPPDKGRGLLRFAADHGLDPATILTIGDAPNDAGLFAPGRFGVTVGTADVPGQREAFDGWLPAYVTSGRESEGFLEVAEALLAR